jgi:hypothetical protein
MKQLLSFFTSQMRIIVTQHKPYSYALVASLRRASIPEKKLLFPDPLRPTNTVSRSYSTAVRDLDLLHCAED